MHMHTRRAFGAVLLAAPLAALPTDPAELTATEALALIRHRKLTPAELTEACLKRIEQRNRRVNAFITVMGESALERARVLRPVSAAREPLHGIPIALKDLYDTAGVRTTAASTHWRDRVPTADAEVVRRLRAAGAVITGKANMDEFAYNFTSETSAFGPARNPWNEECSPGGSSGGSAIAVASGMSLAALGSDTGGSIRLPASFCGITGYKPTFGRVPTDGAAPLAWSLDHVGPMTRSALDAVLLHGVLSGQPVKLAAVKGLRIGLPREHYWQGLDGEVERAVEDAAATLRRLCREVRDVKLPAVERSVDSRLPTVYSTVTLAEAYAFHREMLAQHAERYHAGTRYSIELGKRIDAARYIAARREMERLRSAASTELFRDTDLLLTPTAHGVAFQLGSKPSLGNLRNTSPWNLYGLPTIAIPCGFAKSGLPIGLQITGPPGSDAMVLSAAVAFQAETGFHQRRPKV
jgi:aspartyl-tRNA(Asn)/glutamyl-tRNA(Gln) amidotransferase subunit A